MFVQENIEKLKREWTDKYVVVQGDRPELRRFDGYTGQVKTVNMSGRALVQFDAWANIGWYDIECGYLSVVPKPDPAMAGKKAEKKDAAPAAKAAEAKSAAKPAGGKMSVAEMLAAARANKPAVASAAPAAAAPAKSAAEKPAQPKLAAKPQAAAGGTVLTKGKRPSVAEMVAYCREHDTKG